MTKPRIPNLTFDGRWNNAGLYILIFKFNPYKRTLYSSLHAKGTWTSLCNFFLYIIWKKENVNKRAINWQLSPTLIHPYSKYCFLFLQVQLITFSMWLLSSVYWRLFFLLCVASFHLKCVYCVIRFKVLHL